MKKIAIIKPDYNIIGGFELVVDQLITRLKMMGINIELIPVKMNDNLLKNIQNIQVPPDVTKEQIYRNSHFFNYIKTFWDFMDFNLDRYDVVVSTQPPSFAINHNHHISLFYHHQKIYYDLSTLVEEIGLQQPLHQKATEVIREIDTISLSKASIILAGSQTAKERIKKYNQIEKNVDVIRAGIHPDFYHYNGPISYEYPIVIGRHEFPKRPELFVSAMKKIQNTHGVVIGTGGRTNDLRKIDKILTYSANENIYIPDEIVWKYMSNGKFTQLHEAIYKKAQDRKMTSNVFFAGRLNKTELIKKYSSALCVVCPAYEEDYGLTALEAMAFKKPVIVCNDGGGYKEFIENGVNGFIVEPHSSAIANAIETLINDKKLAVEMGKNAYEYSRHFTWENATKKLLEYF